MYNKENEQLNKKLVNAYHNVLRLEETKRKYSRTTTSFRSRNLMEYLYDNGPTKASTLSDFLKITRPSTSTILDKLEELGYIERANSKEDERSVLVKLTRKGRLVTTYQVSHRNEMLNKILMDFTESEQDVLLKGFEKLNEVLDTCSTELETVYGKKQEVRKLRRGNK